MKSTVLFSHLRNSRTPGRVRVSGNAAAGKRFSALWRRRSVPFALSLLCLVPFAARADLPTYLFDRLPTPLKLPPGDVETLPLNHDGSFYGEIPDFQGVYANARTLESCREELQEVLEEWVFFRISNNLALP